MPSEPFAPGETVLVVDLDGNRHLVRLTEGGSLHHHQGRLRHDDLIGQPDGSVVRSQQGRPFVVARPRVTDFVFAQERRTGIVYPKDAAHIIQWADIGPGMRVLESGTGSGALSVALLRAVGERGTLLGYEIRRDFLDLTLANVRAFFGGLAGNLLLRERDIYEGIVDEDLDRVALDLPEPWRVIPHLEGHLRPGGWLSAYTPSIVQAARLTESIHSSKRFVQVETHEILLRGWHIEGLSVRPMHQMVGHTGFITVARLLSEELPA